MNTLQTWLLLRPLIVFVVAGPAFVFAALLGLRKKRPDTAQCLEARGGPRFALSASGVWCIHADRLSQLRSSNDAAPAAQKRAA
jgi:hypothetical protein